MCEAQGIKLEGCKVYIDSESESDEEAVFRVTKTLSSCYVPEWREKSIPSDMDQNGHAMSARRRKLHIHFTLVSSEYHLCNMNEVHHRSPSQSLLNRMENMGDSIEIKSMYTNYPNTFGKLETYDNDTPFEKESFVDEPIETSWSFQYASYPYTYAANEAVTFLGKCYLLGEELMPLLVNLKGVVEQVEFYFL